MANGQIPLNPLSAAFRGFQSGQQAAIQAAQRQQALALQQQALEQRALNDALERQIFQARLVEMTKTPEQRAQEAAAAAVITQAIQRGGVRAAEPGLKGLEIALPRALMRPSQELLEMGRITPEQAAAEAQGALGPMEFETPVPGLGGAFTESPVLARQAEADRIAQIKSAAEARRTTVPPGFQLVTDENGLQSLVQVRGAGAGTGIVTPVKTQEGEQLKGRVPGVGRSVLAEDQSGRITNIVLRSGESLPEGYKEHVKATKKTQDPTIIRKEFNGLQVVKDYREIVPQFQRMQEALEEAKTTNTFTAVDQTLINTFNKILDPQSVVRESEYARTAEDQSVIDFLRGKIDPKTGKIFVGGAGLSPSNREAMVRMAERFVNTSRRNFDQTASFYENVAEQSGIDPTQIIQGIEQVRERAAEGTTVAAPATTAPSIPIQIKSIRRKQ